MARIHSSKSNSCHPSSCSFRQASHRNETPVVHVHAVFKQSGLKTVEDTMSHVQLSNSSKNSLQLQSSRPKHTQTESQQDTVHCCPNSLIPQLQVIPISRSNSLRWIPFCIRQTSLGIHRRNNVKLSSCQDITGLLRNCNYPDRNQSKPSPNRTQSIAVRMARIHSSNKYRNQTLVVHYQSTFSRLSLKKLKKPCLSVQPSK